MSKKIKTIKCAPTWEGILPLLLQGTRSHSKKTREQSLGELTRMAQLADRQSKAAK